MGNLGRESVHVYGKARVDPILFSSRLSEYWGRVALQVRAYLTGLPEDAKSREASEPPDSRKEGLTRKKGTKVDKTQFLGKMSAQ